MKRDGKSPTDQRPAEPDGSGRREHVDDNQQHHDGDLDDGMNEKPYLASARLLACL